MQGSEFYLNEQELDLTWFKNKRYRFAVVYFELKQEIFKFSRIINLYRIRKMVVLTMRF